MPGGKYPDYFRVKNQGQGYGTGIQPPNKGAIQTPKIRWDIRTPIQKQKTGQGNRPHHRGIIQRGYSRSIHAGGYTTHSTQEREERRTKKRTKQTNKREETRLEASHSKASEDMMKHRTQSDKRMC